MSSGGRRIFQAGGSALCERAAAAERFLLIVQLAAQHSVAWLCRQLGVARSGFYAWRQRQEAPGKRATENALLTAEIEALFQVHRGFSGSPRIHQELEAAGLRVGRHRVARLIRRAQLRARTLKMFRLLPRPAAVLLGWWRTCSSRASGLRLTTGAGHVT